MFFFNCSNTGALICNYLLENASTQQEFSTMIRQDGHLQFDTKWNNLRSYVHGQLCLEQAKVAIAGGSLKEWMETKVLLICLAMQGFRLIVNDLCMQPRWFHW
jgi:hypothetical protein